jgi:acetyl-CoA acetyltransferase
VGCAVDLDLARVNPNGSGIAPIGATGALITVKAIYELPAHRRKVCAGDDVHRRRAGHCRHL